MSIDFHRLWSDYQQCGSVSSAEYSAMLHRAQGATDLSDEDTVQLLESFAQHGSPPGERQQGLLTACLARLGQRQRILARQPQQRGIPSAQTTAAKLLYGQLRNVERARGYLLAWLGSGSGDTALQMFADLVVEDPPTDPTAIGLAFAPLFQTAGASAAVFPRLLEGLGHRRVAPLILDLANYLTRQRLVEKHPADARRDELLALLTGLIGHLGKLENVVPEGAGNAQEMAAQVSDSVALVIALCDALALLHEGRAISRLYQTLELRHRRVQTEAAAALARLGEAEGEELLCRLAAEPIARLRVIAYSDELGIGDRIPPHFRSPVAVAEAELASWLAETTQMGLAPSSFELVDTRTQYWPGYEEPRNCYLFRFRYDFGQLTYQNLGIAGPLTHAFSADLQHLSLDDVYAAFAGWQAEHAEIYEQDWSELSSQARQSVRHLAEALVDAGYEEIRPLRVGNFFGDQVLLVNARQDAAVGTAIVDEQEIAWFPQRPAPRPLSPEDAYSIYKGRKLLRAFNE